MCYRCDGVSSISDGLQAAAGLLLYHCATACGRCTTRSQRWMHCFDALDNVYASVNALLPVIIDDFASNFVR